MYLKYEMSYNNKVIPTNMIIGELHKTIKKQ